MLATFIRFEIKNLLRDEMTRVMLFYPIVLGGLARLLLNRHLLTSQFAAVTAVVLVILAAGFDFGMIAGFSLLDDRDDHVLVSVRISPVSMDLYVWVKVAFAFLIAVLAGVATILISGTFTVSALTMFLVALLAAMQVPTNAFLVSALARDRAEGIAATKFTGILVFLPVVAWLLTGWKQWLLAFVPGFWPTKAIQSLPLALSANTTSHNPGPFGFTTFIGVGFLWCLIAAGLAFVLFRRRPVTS
jgi:fluoroquinolone transport system permease protein